MVCASVTGTARPVRTALQMIMHHRLLLSVLLTTLVDVMKCVTEAFSQSPNIQDLSSHKLIIIGVSRIQLLRAALPALAFAVPTTFIGPGTCTRQQTTCISVS